MSKDRSFDFTPLSPAEAEKLFDLTGFTNEKFRLVTVKSASKYLRVETVTLQLSNGYVHVIAIQESENGD